MVPDRIVELGLLCLAILGVPVAQGVGNASCSNALHISGTLTASGWFACSTLPVMLDGQQKTSTKE